MNNIIKISFPLIVTLLLSGCLSSPYYQKEYTIPDYKWTYQYQPDFKINITKPNEQHNMQFLIRHTEAYPYANIWLMVHIKKPGDTTFQRVRVEVPLAEPTGKWLGRGMGEIWEQRMPLNLETDSSFLATAGTWEFKINHDMRMEPLPEILQVGLRVEQTTKP